MTSTSEMTLEERLQRIEDRLDLSALIAKYCHAVDDRDIEAVLSLFTDDGSYTFGSFTATGPAELDAFYRGRLGEYGPTFHYVHTQLVQFDGWDAATGLVSAHAEIARDGDCSLAGIRYDDRYLRTAAGWKLAGRVVSFRYALPWSEISDHYGDDLRQRWRGEATATGFPERLPTWADFYRRA